jgi:Xanthomonas XOO_2897-like deaminase
MGDGGITRIIDETAKALEESGKKITTAISSRLHDLGQFTKKAANGFDRAEGEIADKVPVYMVDHDGNVSKLVNGKLEGAYKNGKLQSWVGEDEGGISKIMDGDGTTPTWEKGKYRLGERDTAHDDDPGHIPRNPVDSTRIDPDETELSRATAKARLGVPDDGGGNYASFHYKDGDGNEFILVGNSEPRGAHSEQFAGVPFLDKGVSHNVVGVYTERSPCVKGQRNCSAWLGRYFQNKDLQVSHTFDYTPATKDLANDQLGHYVEGLFS